MPQIMAKVQEGSSKRIEEFSLDAPYPMIKPLKRAVSNLQLERWVTFFGVELK